MCPGIVPKAPLGPGFQTKDKLMNGEEVGRVARAGSRGRCRVTAPIVPLKDPCPAAYEL